MRQPALLWGSFKERTVNLAAGGGISSLAFNKKCLKENRWKSFQLSTKKNVFLIFYVRKKTILTALQYHDLACFQSFFNLWTQWEQLFLRIPISPKSASENFRLFNFR